MILRCFDIQFCFMNEYIYALHIIISTVFVLPHALAANLLRPMSLSVCVPNFWTGVKEGLRTHIFDMIIS